MRMLDHIRCIRIELESSCNRECQWCPRNCVDNEYSKLSDETYTKLLKDLKDSGFCSHPFPQYRYQVDKKNTMIPQIIFTGFSEPFSDSELLKRRAREAFDTFGQVNIICETNGDLIQFDDLNNLTLTNLVINDYDGRGFEYWEDRLSGLGIVILEHDVSNNTLYAIHRYINSVVVHYDWKSSTSIVNMGGVIADNLNNVKWKNGLTERTVPCPECEYMLNIRSDGSVMPCICMHQAYHNDYVLGNVNTTSVQDIYYSEKAENIRTALRDEKILLPPCKQCHHMGMNYYKGSPSEWEYNPERLYQNGEKIVDMKVHNLNKKTRGRSTKKWTAEQKLIWESICDSYSLVNIDDIIYPDSVFNKLGMFSGKNYISFIKSYYNLYCDLLERIKNVYEYTYIDFLKDPIIDHEDAVTFDGFSFTLESMACQFLKTKGVYQPFFAFERKKAGFISICAGRHRIQALRHLMKNGHYIQQEYLCIFFDLYKDHFSQEILVPINLYDYLFTDNTLDGVDIIQTDVFNGIDVYVVSVKDITSLWMLIRIFEREFDHIVERFFTDMVNSNIYPSAIINKPQLG